MKRILRNKDTGSVLVRYFKSLNHALSGILYALRYEHNMIIIFSAIIVTSAMGLYFDISGYEWLFCLVSFAAVAATEMVNTSIEALVDLATNKYHPLAKIAKDTASSATLIFSITSFIGGLIIFAPKIIEMIG
ncbi:MAG: diacylglycerol kinase family protein [Bacilli bacterium]